MSYYNLYIISSYPFTKIPYETLHETLVKKTSLNDLHYHFTCDESNKTDRATTNTIYRKNHAFANHFDSLTYLEYLYLQKRR